MHFGVFNFFIDLRNVVIMLLTKHTCAKASLLSLVKVKVLSKFDVKCDVVVLAMVFEFINDFLVLG